MANINISGSVNMDALRLGDLQGQEITQTDPTIISIMVGRGVINSVPGVSPGQLTGLFSLNGVNFTYDANDQLTGGTVKGLSYDINQDGAGATHSLHVSGFEIPAAQIYQWFASGDTQAALSAILSGADTFISDDLYSGNNEYVSVDVLRGYGGNDTIYGGRGADTIYGGAGDDVIIGGPNNSPKPDSDNLLRGDDGNDVIIGGNRTDDIDGGAGNDTLTGDDDFSRTHTTTGADLFRVSPGSDQITDFHRAEGDQIIIAPGVTYNFAQQGADVVVNFSDGARLTLANIDAGSLTGAWITTGGSTPPPAGGGGSGGSSTSFNFDTITADQAAGFRAIDKLVFTAGSATQTSVLFGTDAVTIALGGKAVAFGEGIISASQAGHISLPDGSLMFIGTTASEKCTGGGTSDAAFGGLGDDTMDGAGGDDLLQGNQGGDRLIGGDGADTVYGGQDDDVLVLGGGFNFGQGNRGNDNISAGDNADTLLGGQDNDTIQGAGGADFLNGNRGDDSISGGDGNDVLYGEGGADTLSGGAGADIFHGFAGGEVDRVVDFSMAEGDKVVLDTGTAYTVSHSGGDTVISYGGGAQIILVGVSSSALTGDWITA